MLCAGSTRQLVRESFFGLVTRPIQWPLATFLFLTCRIFVSQERTDLHQVRMVSELNLSVAVLLGAGSGMFGTQIGVHGGEGYHIGYMVVLEPGTPLHGHAAGFPTEISCHLGGQQEDIPKLCGLSLS